MKLRRCCICVLGLATMLGAPGCGSLPPARRLDSTGLPTIATAATSAPTATVTVGESVPAAAARRRVGAPSERARAAIEALQGGDFEGAEQAADQIIVSGADDPYARLVWAVSRYRGAMHQLSIDVRTAVIGGLEAGGFNHRYMRSSLAEGLAALGAVDEALGHAAAVDDLALELCLACWEVDWNNNRRLDSADRLLFQIEQDEQGKELAENDPRRKPTFRFDHGDVLWARAFVGFQRAAIELVLAYDWDALDDVLAGIHGREPKRLVFRLRDPAGVARARQLILGSLALSDQCRRAYLDETDDDREWVPSPSQRSHPLPLPVDEKLYETWAGALGDLERLVRGEEGLSVSELAQLGEHRWKNPPRGYLDIGAMLARPKDIVIHPQKLEKALDAHDVETALADVLGEYYVRQMKPSGLIARLERMKSEVDRGEESAERKLRYLVWLN